MATKKHQADERRQADEQPAVQEKAGPTAATEAAIAAATTQAPTPAQAHEIDELVESTGLPRAIITEQVLVKHKDVDAEATVVNAEDDDASRAALQGPAADFLPEPKRVVAGTPQAQTDAGLGDRKQDPLAE